MIPHPKYEEINNTFAKNSKHIVKHLSRIC